MYLAVQRPFPRLVTQFLFTFATMSAMAIYASSANATEAPLATKGKLVVGAAEARSAAFFATPEQRERLRDDQAQWQPIVEEALTIKEWLQSDIRKALTPAELAAVEYRARLADVRAGVDALTQREVARLRGDIGVLESRAKELWLADDGKYFTPTTAQVNLIFIDAHKRGLKDATARYQQAARRFKRGEPIDRIAKALSDIVPGQKTQLPLPMTVELQAIEGAARRAIFRDLKLGELSGPIPTPEGWILAQVLEIKKPERRPFEDVKKPIMEAILLDASASTRLAIMAKLGEPQIEFSSAVLPDPVRARDAKAVATAASQLAVEMKQRNMTPVDVERRLQELLELAKTAPAEPPKGVPAEPQVPAPKSSTQ